MTDLTRELRSIELTMPNEELGTLIQMFDDACLGLSLRQQYTVLKDTPEKGITKIGVAYIHEQQENAERLVEAFKATSWAHDPRIEVKQLPPSTIESAAAAKAMLAKWEEQTLGVR